MKNLQYLVSKGHQFMVDEEHPFLITKDDVGHISRVGALVYRLLTATQHGLAQERSAVWDILSDGAPERQEALQALHPERLPVLIRVDLMIDTDGNWLIAEIDPCNKHGTGFGLATRDESGAGERQKLLTLLSPYITTDTAIVMSKKESFFHREQEYLAQRLSAHTGKRVRVVASEKLLKTLRSDELVLDIPSHCVPETTSELVRIWQEEPQRIINPPRNLLGGKAIMTLPYEQASWLIGNGMTEAELQELRSYLPATYHGPFVTKEVFSSGAKGISFGASDKKVVVQRYVRQKQFVMDGTPKFIRMACTFVGPSLGELVVSANEHLPVHGGQTTVNYHVNVT